MSARQKIFGNNFKGKPSVFGSNKLKTATSKFRSLQSTSISTSKLSPQSRSVVSANLATLNTSDIIIEPTMEAANLNITVHGQAKKRNNDGHDVVSAKKSYFSEVQTKPGGNIEVADSDEDEAEVDSQCDPFKESTNHAPASEEEFQFKVPKIVEKTVPEEICFTQRMQDMSRAINAGPPAQRSGVFRPKFTNNDIGGVRMESTQAMWDISNKFDQTNGFGDDRANMHGIAESPRISKRNSQKDDLMAIATMSPKSFVPLVQRVDAGTQTDTIDERPGVELCGPKTTNHEYRPNGNIENELLEKWEENFQVQHRRISKILADLQRTHDTILKMRNKLEPKHHDEN